MSDLGTVLPASEPRLAAALIALLMIFTLFGCARPAEQAKPVAATKSRVKAEKITPKPEKIRSKLVTADQNQVIATLGRPKQFILAYTPVEGDDGKGLARMETWYYPKHRKKITFVAGDALSVRPMPDAGEAVYPKLKIEDFNYSMGYKAVVRAIGGGKVEPIEFANEIFARDGVKSYLTAKATFTIERGHLVYFQSLGVKK